MSPSHVQRGSEPCDHSVQEPLVLLPAFSRHRLQRYLAICDGVGGESQCSCYACDLERREILDDLSPHHSVRDHPDNRGHRDAETADARHTSHLSGVDW